MGRQILLMAGILLFCTGCASHYFQLNGDTLRMYLKGPDAEIVYFSSSLDGYELHRARRVAAKTWEVRLPANGEFTYYYIVDGTVYLPPCRLKEYDDFGSENCVYTPDL
jgi:hypothetical protein